MNIDELTQLLPFFVAGTLDQADRKKVEEALMTSIELRKELEFWQRSTAILAMQGAYAAAGHLTPQQIVDRAEGRTTGDQLLACDRHLQTCAECSDEVRRVRESLEPRAVDASGLLPRLAHIISSIRLAYAVPALALAIVAVIYYSSRTEKPTLLPLQPGATSQAPGQPPQPANDTASVWLTYRAELRSMSRRALPSYMATDGHSYVRFVVAIPRSTISSIRYRTIVAAKGMTAYTLPLLLQRYSSGTAYDSLHFVLSREHLPKSGKSVTITISEVLPPDLTFLTPEEYRFEVVLN